MSGEVAHETRPLERNPASEREDDRSEQRVDRPRRALHDDRSPERIVAATESPEEVRLAGREECRHHPHGGDYDTALLEEPRYRERGVR